MYITTKGAVVVNKVDRKKPSCVYYIPNKINFVADTKYLS